MPRASKNRQKINFRDCWNTKRVACTHLPSLRGIWGICHDTCSNITFGIKQSWYWNCLNFDLVAYRLVLNKNRIVKLMNTISNVEKPRIKALDSLRGFAALTVLKSHLAGGVVGSKYTGLPPLYLLTAGYWAVMFFFIEWLYIGISICFKTELYFGTFSCSTYL